MKLAYWKVAGFKVYHSPTTFTRERENIYIFFHLAFTYKSGQPGLVRIEEMSASWNCLPLTLSWRGSPYPLKQSGHSSRRSASVVSTTATRSLLNGVTDDRVLRLQSVPNAAVRRDHITPIPRELHWLPIRQRVRLKLATFAYKPLHGAAPAHLSDECTLIAGSGLRHLRSSDNQTVSAPRTHSRLRDRGFVVAEPRTWNSLLVTLWLP